MNQGEVSVARLTDPDRSAAYRDALANWRYDGYIDFDMPFTAYRWIREEFEAFGIRSLGRLMHEYVAGGGVVDEVEESRPGWRDLYEFHYDLRFTIQGKPIYVETRLKYRLPVVPDASWILVVNVHAP